MATKSCLLIVDVQHGFINEHTRHVPEAVEKGQSDYEFVYATRFFNMADSLYRRLIGWHRMERGTPEFELAFQPRGDARIIDKPIYTCVDKLFLDELQGLGIRSVDVCGIETDICVTKCAVDLFEQGIEPRVLAALCGTTAGPRAHEAALGTLARFIGKGQIIG